MAPPRVITLVGMPGVGKSTVGRLLADRLGWTFTDLDTVIEQQAGKKLWQIIEAGGNEALAKAEEEAGATFDADQVVLAPGGSIVYFERAVAHLTTLGPVIYLHAPPELLEKRAGDLKARGVIIRPGMTYADLIAERDPLYRRWADRIIDCGRNTAEQIADTLALELAS